MAVTERLMGAGNFSVTFSQEQTPTAIIEAIKEWGHIVITPQEVDIDTLSDSGILSAARYTGIILNRTLEEGSVSINGQGLELYMGDGQAKGMVIAESNNVGKVRTYTGTTLAETLFNSTAQTNKPLGIMRDEAGNSQAITQGTITNPAGTYTGSHFVETALSALKFVCEILNVEYKLNANGTLDAGPSANLFEGVGTSQPNSIIVKTAYGQDPEFEGVVPQGLRTEFDATDWVSRVDFTGEVGFFDTATDVAGEANLGTNPYKDLHGNALKRVGLIQEPDVPEANLNTRATTLLNELSRVKKVLNLDLEQYEVTGDMKVGDFIYAFDPDVGFKDTAADAAAESRSLYEITFRGQTITPVKIRVLGITFPITSGMGCYFRDKDGNYTDLTQYVQYETGAAQIELGDLIRTIGDDLRFSEFSLSRSTAGAFSIPNLPATPTLQAGTYLNATGVSSGFIRVTVARPTNLDGSQITDGSHYKVRYKKTTDSEYSYQNFPYTGASSESLLIQDMTVGITYDVGVAVVDKSGFKAMSAYDGSGSDLYTNSSSVNANFATNARVEIEKDGQAPSKPKTATSIATGPLKVQITHHLGKDGTDGSGNPFGNFTLEGDLDYLAVHAVTQSGNSANFTVSASNKIGEIRVTAGNLLQSIPLVGSADLADSSGHYFRFVAVDKSGNASNPSDGQTGTASLIEETHIKDATITDVKIGTAQITGAKIANATITDANIGSLNADKINAGSIDASQIAVTNLSASNIASGTLSANLISGGSISANLISGGTLSGNVISGGTIEGTTINAGNLTISGKFGFSDLDIDSNDLINTIAENAILTKISDGSIDQAKLGTLTVGNANVTGQLDFNKLSIDSTDIISTIADEAIANAKIASGIDASKLDGFTQSTTSLVQINASNGLSILSGPLAMNNNGIDNANDIELNNGSSFNSSGNLLATGYVSTNSSTSRLEMNNSFVYLKPGNSFGLNIGTSNSTVYSNFRPNSNGSKDLGASSLRWNTVHRISESSTSDERLKDNIVDLTQGLDFINVLEPKEFTWKSISLGFECDTCGEMYSTDDECTSQIMDEDKDLVDCDGTLSEIFTEDTGQKVFGFIAQDMLEHLPNSTDYQLLSHNEDDEYLYSQENLVAPLVKAVQELSARVEALEG
tara:strand:+ start:3776 stop:7228 length:3453 start_codon:yes stop_codon:yes gene_type:complete